MSHQKPHSTVLAAVLATFLVTIPPASAQAPVTVSTYGATFAPAGRGGASEIVGKMRRFHGQAGERVVLRALLNMPPGSSGAQKMQRLTVRFRSAQAYLANVELRNGSASAFRIQTRLEGDHMGEAVKPDAIANTWVWREPVRVDAHSAILLEVQFAGGFEGNSAHKEFLIASVDVEFSGKPRASSAPAASAKSLLAWRTPIPGPLPGAVVRPVIAPVAELLAGWSYGAALAGPVL